MRSDIYSAVPESFDNMIKCPGQKRTIGHLACMKMSIEHSENCLQQYKTMRQAGCMLKLTLYSNPKKPIKVA